jgi:hypothetical protein
MKLTQTQIERIQAELDPVDTHEYLDEIIDANYNFDLVGGPFAYMLPSQVFREMDPIGYKEALLEQRNFLLEEGEAVEVGEDLYWKSDIEDLLGELEDDTND